MVVIRLSKQEAVQLEKELEPLYQLRLAKGLLQACKIAGLLDKWDQVTTKIEKGELEDQRRKVYLTPRQYHFLTTDRFTDRPVKTGSDGRIIRGEERISIRADKLDSYLPFLKRIKANGELPSSLRNSASALIRKREYTSRKKGGFGIWITSKQKDLLESLNEGMGNAVDHII